MELLFEHFPILLAQHLFLDGCTLSLPLFVLSSFEGFFEFEIIMIFPEQIVAKLRIEVVETVTTNVVFGFAKPSLFILVIADSIKLPGQTVQWSFNNWCQTTACKFLVLLLD